MTKNIKIARYESLIIDVINKTILFEVNDKVAKMGRVTYVQLTNDLSKLDVFIDCLDRKKIEYVCSCLNKISGLFRSKIAKAIDTYKVPKIIFKIDKTIDYAQNIDTIINKLHEGDK